MNIFWKHYLKALMASSVPIAILVLVVGFLTLAFFAGSYYPAASVVVICLGLVFVYGPLAFWSSARF